METWVRDMCPCIVLPLPDQSNQAQQTPCLATSSPRPTAQGQLHLQEDRQEAPCPAHVCGHPPEGLCEAEEQRTQEAGPAGSLKPPSQAAPVLAAGAVPPSPPAAHAADHSARHVQDAKGKGCSLTGISAGNWTSLRPDPLPNKTEEVQIPLTTTFPYHPPTTLPETPALGPPGPTLFTFTPCQSSTSNPLPPEGARHNADLVRFGSKVHTAATQVPPSIHAHRDSAKVLCWAVPTHTHTSVPHLHTLAHVVTPYLNTVPPLLPTLFPTGKLRSGFLYSLSQEAIPARGRALSHLKFVLFHGILQCS